MLPQLESGHGGGWLIVQMSELVKVFIAEVCCTLDFFCGQFRDF